MMEASRELARSERRSLTLVNGRIGIMFYF